MASQFEGKVVIVTGGNSGIGSATVQTFLALGAKVASFDISEPAEGTSNANLFSVKCNVTSEDSVNTSVKEVANKFGHIDVLVNCAGVMDAFETPGDTSTASWEKVLSINLNGPFYLTRAVIPFMLQNDPKPLPNAAPTFTRQGQPQGLAVPSKGSIVNICSVASFGGGSAGTPYTVSKHGLLGLTRSTAWMHRADGIRCNAVMPGGTATNIYQNSQVQFDPQGKGFQASQIYQNCMPPLIRAPDVVANAVVFLAGAEHVSGSEIAVDGGWSVA